jgi:hypothetical protein
MNLSGYYAATIYNPVTGVGAQLNLVGEESEMQLREPFDNDKTGRGEFVYSGDNSFMNLVAYDLASNVVSTLESFMTQGTRCQVALIGVNEVVLWEEPAKIKISKPKIFGTGRRQRLNIRIAKEGGVHKIYDGVNILRARHPWGSLGSALPGYEFTGVLNQAFTDDENIIDFDDTSQVLRSNIIVPVSGVTATLSYDRRTQHSLGFYTTSIQALSFANTVIETVSTTVLSNTPTGIIQVAIKLPVNTFRIRCNLIVTPTDDPQEVSIASPRLRFDGKNTDIRS